VVIGGAAAAVELRQDGFDGSRRAIARQQTGDCWPAFAKLNSIGP
jgi:hypothetical protein